MDGESTRGCVSADWLGQLRSIHEESLDRDWEGLGAAVNEQFGLTGTAALRQSIKGLPPIWFQGDVERIQPGEWVLVTSLNHQLPTAKEYAMVTRESAWHIQCDHHRDHWYEGFFGPLARVAAVAMGLTGDAVDLKSYASEHVVFTELCPYASASFGLDPEQVSHLVQSDAAFRTAAQIRGILLEHGQPALVLVNGRTALEPFEVVHAGRFRWSPRHRYASVDPPRAGKPPKMLWHQEGIYQADAAPIPVIGFPFLRKPRTYNSNRELDQLGEHARQFAHWVGCEDARGGSDA